MALCMKRKLVTLATLDLPPRDCLSMALLGESCGDSRASGAHDSSRPDRKNRRLQALATLSRPGRITGEARLSFPEHGNVPLVGDVNDMRRHGEAAKRAAGVSESNWPVGVCGVSCLSPLRMKRRLVTLARLSLSRHREGEDSSTVSKESAAGRLSRRSEGEHSSTVSKEGAAGPEGET
jgi:hypothetical protein